MCTNENGTREMMPRCLFKVSDTFQIKGRGIVLLPGVVPEGSERFHFGEEVELRRPDGTVFTTNISLEVFSPIPSSGAFALFLPNIISTDEVPVGTEVWSTSNETKGVALNYGTENYKDDDPLRTVPADQFGWNLLFSFPLITLHAIFCWTFMLAVEKNLQNHGIPIFLAPLAWLPGGLIILATSGSPLVLIGALLIICGTITAGFWLSSVIGRKLRRLPIDWGTSGWKFWMLLLLWLGWIPLPTYAFRWVGF
jgi:hypothetical protein